MSDLAEAPSVALETRPADGVLDGHGAAAPDRGPGGHSLWRRVRVQLGVATGQGLAGVGNMLFSLVTARILAPRDFAHLAAFAALYLAISTPSNGLMALAAIRPGSTKRLQRQFGALGAGIGVLVAAACLPLGSLLGLPFGLILCLAAAIPVAPLLAIAKGRLYGWERNGGVVASLLAEPVVRLTLGVALADLLGAGGGALGVVIAGVAAFEVARRVGLGASRRRHAPRPADTPLVWRAGARPQTIAAVMFLVFGVAQNIDLLMANRLLGSFAPDYAALSTLGGIAAFATVTIPLVALPRAAKGDAKALPVALAVAGAVGLAAVIVALPDPGLVVRLLLGARYESVAPLLALYLAAMACFGAARVVAAHNLAVGRGAAAMTLAATALVGQAIAILAVPRTVPAVAHTTMATMAALTVAEAAVAFPGSSLQRRLWAAIATPTGLAVTAATLVGLGVRLYIPRGFWLDEATSIFEARMPYGRMIAQLYNYDVHPPLYFTLLWADMRLLGDGQLAIRTVSVLFGAAIVPVAYLAGRDLYDRRTGVVAATLSIVAPLMVWYSQEARMYSMFMFFALVAVWAQARTLRRGRAFDWVVWVASAAALGWTEYFGLFLVLCQVLIYAIQIYRWRHEERGRRLRLPCLLSAAALTLLLLPLVYFAFHQFIVNQNAGRGFGGPSQVGTGAAGTTAVVNVYSILANLLWATIGYQPNGLMADLGALWPLGILACLLVMGRRHRGETKLLVACAFGPLVLDVLLAADKPSLLDVRYVSALAPLLTLLAARVVTGTTRKAGSAVLACGLAVAVLTAGLVDQQSNGSNPRRYDFQRALGDVNREFVPGDLLVYDPSDLGQVIDYYSPTERHAPLTTSQTNPPPGHKLFVLASASLMTAEPDRYRLYLLLSRLRAHDRQVQVIAVANVTVWVFQR